MQGQDGANIGARFYTLNYIWSTDISSSIQSYIDESGTEYFVASSIGAADISRMVLPRKLAWDWHKQEMVSQRCAR
jgi:hypothetical protein